LLDFLCELYCGAQIHKHQMKAYVGNFYNSAINQEEN